ncbi:MAG: N-acetylglutaminylglutamine synthetase [Betaproteobacteria bacterium]|jgi:GNAT-family acetyltransferase (TIGR03103 family)|nr:N-acetylglutaminylglutamine synthetase [Betaproteobacteria bacterium]
MTATQRSTRTRKRRERGAYAHRFQRLRGRSAEQTGRHNVNLDCGWGRLLFGQTFLDPAALAAALLEEDLERRDIACYVRDPHVVLAAAPQHLFLDPSHTFRLDLTTYRVSNRVPRGFAVRLLVSEADGDAVNRIYLARSMVPVPSGFMFGKRDSRTIVYLVAEDEGTGAIIGTVTGVDHRRAFGDPEQGASLWCLAVDPQAVHPKIGEALVRRLAEYFQARGALHLDLSVMHDNREAIDLYQKLGFVRIPEFTVKHKNPINEKLFVGRPPEQALNPYARLLTEEARRRGIGVEVVDAEGGFFRLTSGGRSVLCRESLSELTSGVAVSICDDKAVTRRVVERAGVRVPAQIEFESREQLAEFLASHGSVVVKPARGEQGRGIAVGVDDLDAAITAVERARAHCDRVLVEACVQGEDLRLVVIDYKVVAAALRRPARIVGDGQSTVRGLIERQSRRRAAATSGESKIPLDAETERCLAGAGLAFDDVPEKGAEIQVRRTANLHTGGTIHDVTDEVHPELVAAAVRAARAIGIPVTGIDFIVRSPRAAHYAFIEANERPGLANHEPQPTAERFIDLLFPLSMPAAARQASV